MPYHGTSLLFRWRLTIKHPRCKLSSTARLVMFALNAYMDADGMCFAGVKKIAQAAGLGRSTVFRYLDELETAGYIERERRAYNSTIYKARIPWETEGMPWDPDDRPIQF